MNKILRDTAISFLKEHMNKMPEANQCLFKLMYGRNYGKRSVEDAKKLSIDDCIDGMPDDKLDWAMQQVINTERK